jgi:hypothetical protein
MPARRIIIRSASAPDDRGIFTETNLFAAQQHYKNKIGKKKNRIDHCGIHPGHFIPFGKGRTHAGGDNQKAQMLIRNFSGAIHNQLLLRIE